MESPAKNHSLASIARTVPIDLNKRIEAAILLARAPATEPDKYMRDLNETIRLRCRADIFATLAHQLEREQGLRNGIATIEQMEPILRELVTSKHYRNCAVILDDHVWRKVVSEVKHDLVATAIETTQAHVKARKGKIFSETAVAVSFAKILQDLSNPGDVEEEDFL